MGNVQEAIARAVRRPAVVLFALAALLATQIVPWWGPTPDAAAYLSIARSIARGGPVTNLGSPKLHYAPGYPLLISPAFLTGDRPFLLLAAMQWLLAVAFMQGLYRWSRRWFAGAELWITALVMANASLWLHARLTMSEMAFMALMMWTLEATDRLGAAAAPRAAMAWTTLVAVLIAALSLLRPVGVLVVCGYGVAMAVRAWRGQATWTRAIVTTMASGLPASLAIVGMLAYEVQTGERVRAGDGTYLHEFKAPQMSVAAQLVEGVRLRVTEAGRLTVPGMHKAYDQPGEWLTPNMAVYVPLFCGLTWAWWRVARRGDNVLVLALPFFLALYIAYPFDQGTRYLLPLLPVLVVCVWQLTRYAPRYRVPILSGLVAAHLTVALATSAISTYRWQRHDERWAAVDAFAAVIHGEPRPVLATFGIQEMMALSTDRMIESARVDAAIPPHVGWLIAPVDAPRKPGFTERATIADVTLWEREEQLTHDELTYPGADGLP